MPVTMGGLASGLDTDSIVEKLVKIEARPIQRWTNEKETSRKRKDALGILKSHLSTLNNSAKNLYGFRASYEEKKVISSNLNIVKATANKAAEIGEKRVTVKELASTHKIATDKIDKDKKIPAIKFKIEVNGESETIRFKGGKIESLRNKIDDIASELVSTSYIKTDKNNYILTIESKMSGKKGEIILTGDRKKLKRIGLIKGEKGEKKNKVSLLFDKKYFISYTGEREIEEQNGNIKVEKKGKSIDVKGLLWREYVMPTSVLVEKNTILEVNIDYKEEKLEIDEKFPYRVEFGPEEEIIIKGIKLHGYNVSRVRPSEKVEKKKPVEYVLGIGAVSIKNGNRMEKIYDRRKDVKGKQVLPIGKDFSGKKISKIVFYCIEGSANFSRASIITPVEGIGVLEPKNEIKKASDAILDVDGIEIIRDKNNSLNDVIKGITLNLRRSSPAPITLTIEPDIEKAMDRIKEFVKSYNDYLELNKKLTKSLKISKPGSYKKAKYENGLFVGDMSIQRLENSLKTAIGDSYPNRADNPIKILVQAGVSTGEINAGWESIKEGKLVVDEEKLSVAIVNNPEGISEFFGSDTDGDNRVDNGLAYRVERLLKPYLMSGQSIIVSKIGLENNAIKSFDERIDRHKVHLKKYEEKLKIKFGSMEKSISNSKSQGSWLKMNMGGGNKKKD